MSYGAANVTFPVLHPLGLAGKVRAMSKRFARCSVALPNHGFNVVLEQCPGAQIVDVDSGKQEIADLRVERVFACDLAYGFSHGLRTITHARYWDR